MPLKWNNAFCLNACGCIVIILCLVWERDMERVLGTIRVERKWWQSEREGGKGTGFGCGSLKDRATETHREPGNKGGELSSGCTNKGFVREQRKKEGWEDGERKIKKRRIENWRRSRWVRSGKNLNEAKGGSWSNLRTFSKSWPLLVSCFCLVGILIFMLCLVCASVCMFGCTIEENGFFSQISCCTFPFVVCVFFALCVSEHNIQSVKRLLSVSALELCDDLFWPESCIINVCSMQDNLSVFLRGCEELGLKGSQLFDPGDLQDTSTRPSTK